MSPSKATRKASKGKKGNTRRPSSSRSVKKKSPARKRSVKSSATKRRSASPPRNLPKAEAIVQDIEIQRTEDLSVELQRQTTDAPREAIESEDTPAGTA